MPVAFVFCFVLCWCPVAKLSSSCEHGQTNCIYPFYQYSRKKSTQSLFIDSPTNIPFFSIEFCHAFRLTGKWFVRRKTFLPNYKIIVSCFVLHNIYLLSYNTTNVIVSYGSCCFSVHNWHHESITSRGHNWNVSTVSFMVPVVFSSTWWCSTRFKPFVLVLWSVKIVCTDQPKQSFIVLTHHFAGNLVGIL